MARPGRKEIGLRALAFAALIALLVAIGPAHGQQKVPAPDYQEVMIKALLLTFNDANVTGNYTVMHARLSKAFRDQFSPQRLAEGFKAFRDQKVDIAPIVIKPPVASEPSRIENGVLKLQGHFETEPSRVHYLLEFVQSEGDWKAIRIEVNVKPVK